jgi:hypothetical protein
MRPAAEVLLSYLCGLGPIGQPVEPPFAWLMEDLGYHQKVTIYRCLNDLIRAGAVARIAGGRNGTLGLLVVRRRPEQVELRLPHPPERVAEPVEEPSECAVPKLHMAEWRVTKEERAARLAEIPQDTRNLTQRVFGDPVYERSALASRHRAAQAPVRG